MREAYQKASVFVAPLAGPGGTRLKILGAMAAGVPVITTKVGIEGIEAKNNQEVLIRDDAVGMAQAAIELLGDKQLYQRLTLAARHLFEKKYNWGAIAQKLDKIYEEVGHGKN